MNQLRSDYARSFPATPRAFALSSSRFISLPEGLQHLKNPAVVPRTGLYTDIRVAPDDRKAVEMVMDPSLDPTRTLVLDRPPPFPLSGPKEETAARIVDDSHQRVTIATTSAVPAILLLTDAYFDGWTARVDGSPVPIMRGNYAFRAVAVPAGRHTVEFVYQHPAYRTSRSISLAGAAVLVLLATGWGVRRFIRNST